MEFAFNVNEIFPEPIVEIDNNLIPREFNGNRRQMMDHLGKITQVINAMGEASSRSQGLSKPITTTDRLRNSENKLYFLIDREANNGRGAVTGMLKTGRKGLYVFDQEGQHYQVTPNCVLDFYVPESRQRSGYGKVLFQNMLQKEAVNPVNLAIDRPSDKLINFMGKHYDLKTPIKQRNNFVVFDGFFPNHAKKEQEVTPQGIKARKNKEVSNGLQYSRDYVPEPTYKLEKVNTNIPQYVNNVQSMPETNYQGQIPNQIPVQMQSQSTPNMYYAPNTQQPGYGYSQEQYAAMHGNQQYAQQNQIHLQHQQIQNQLQQQQLQQEQQQIQHQYMLQQLNTQQQKQQLQQQQYYQQQQQQLQNQQQNTNNVDSTVNIQQQPLQQYVSTQQPQAVTGDTSQAQNNAYYQKYYQQINAAQQNNQIPQEQVSQNNTSSFQNVAISEQPQQIVSVPNQMYNQTQVQANNIASNMEYNSLPNIAYNQPAVSAPTNYQPTVNYQEKLYPVAKDIGINALQQSASLPANFYQQGNIPQNMQLQQHKSIPVVSKNPREYNQVNIQKSPRQPVLQEVQQTSNQVVWEMPIQDPNITSNQEMDHIALKPHYIPNYTSTNVSNQPVVVPSSYQMMPHNSSQYLPQQTLSPVQSVSQQIQNKHVQQNMQPVVTSSNQQFNQTRNQDVTQYAQQPITSEVAPSMQQQIKGQTVQQAVAPQQVYTYIENGVPKIQTYNPLYSTNPVYQQNALVQNPLANYAPQNAETANPVNPNIATQSEVKQNGVTQNAVAQNAVPQNLVPQYTVAQNSLPHNIAYNAVAKNTAVQNAILQNTQNSAVSDLNDDVEQVPQRKALDGLQTHRSEIKYQSLPTKEATQNNNSSSEEYDKRNNQYYFLSVPENSREKINGMEPVKQRTFTKINEKGDMQQAHEETFKFGYPPQYAGNKKSKA